MNQPPPPYRSAAGWRRPSGVSPETWDYVQQRSIADRYDAFVADTALCRLDQQLLEKWLPGASQNAAAWQDSGTSQDSGEIVLDLGTGTGRAAIALAERGYRVLAIDLSQPMLMQLRRYLRQINGDHAVFPLRANLVDLDCLHSNSADHAICLFSTLGMIQGREHRLKMLRHAARIVRPGGRLVVHVHNRWAALREPRGLRHLLRSWFDGWRRCEREFGDAVYPYRGLAKMFLHRFSRRELCQDLQQSGWALRKLEQIAIDGSCIDSSSKIPGGFIALAESAA